MKVFERILKVCVGGNVRVNYGRCSAGRGVGKCQVDGILWAFDNLCLVVAVVDEEGSVLRLVVVKKSEVESIELLDRGLISDVYEALYGDGGEAGD